MDFVQDCHYQITQLLYSLDERSQSSGQSGSPYPDSEYLFFYAFNYLLICVLADAPMAPPLFSEDNDAMMVDDHCK